MDKDPAEYPELNRESLLFLRTIGEVLHSKKK